MPPGPFFRSYFSIMPSILSRLIALCAIVGAPAAVAAPFVLSQPGNAPTIIHAEDRTAALSAGLLARDLRALTGQQPRDGMRIADCRAACIVLGTIDSSTVRDVAREAGIDLAPLHGQTERYLRVAVKDRDGRDILLIAGSDKRGAVYGVVDLTRELGISAWEWWADVKPRPDTQPVVDGAFRLSAAPSVQYRGIFLNDEDWGLQPWAAGKDPARDIGPATYARVFELLWRLKANLIWPAMHESTKPFYQIPGNARMAEDYAIVIGTSHAEPLMRNNVHEWDSRRRGPFNFLVNRDAMLDYWRERVDEVRSGENIYTVGLRGVHDSAMEGAATVEQARGVTDDVIGLQRDILARSLGRPASQVPQVLTLYKEVLDVYQAGLKVPDDITLVWPDDNYGYLHQLSNAAERTRAGGAGIYYHISYWGRPHDYLWLGTTHPSLIRDQLQRAWTTGARKLWVVNVGDIKPLEYLTQYFLDNAFDAGQLARDPQEHLTAWSTAQFGDGLAPEIARIMRAYYDLAWERRPEFMGFGQVEPITPNRRTAYMASGGEEGMRRLLKYRALVADAEKLAGRVPPDRRDAYFELVLYPVRGAANLNARVLGLDLAAENARQGRPAANHLVQEAKKAHAQLVADTAAYNALAGGKWAHMMDMAPRRLPVFAEPAWPSYAGGRGEGCSLAYPAPYSVFGDRLAFAKGVPASRTLTLSGHGGKAVAWSVKPGALGVVPDVQGGRLDSANGYEQRIVLRYDGAGEAAVAFECGGTVVKADIGVEPAAPAGLPTEHDNIISVAAGSVAAGTDWELQPGLGTSGRSLRARLDLRPREAGQLADATPLVVEFATRAQADARLRLIAVPVHPLAGGGHVRLAYSLDDGPLEVASFETFGRSDTWKRNVLTNTAVHTQSVSRLPAGRHTLRIYALDPGVVFDRIDVVLDGAPEYYGVPPGSVALP